jgi:uracil-DNA glycosylase family protein
MKPQSQPRRGRQPAPGDDGEPNLAVGSLGALNALISTSEPFITGSRRAVLGEGPLHPALALVGEQPGDKEDLEGRPFVGPAGQLLTRALADAGIDRSAAYLTNAVKHFKYEQRGKRRLHKTPTAGEVRRYRWWLAKELELVKPEVVVALGATAAFALAGKPVPVLKSRGPMMFDGQPGLVTVHPSSLLRITDEAARHDAYAAFVADLAAAKRLSLRRRSGAARRV